MRLLPAVMILFFGLIVAGHSGGSLWDAVRHDPVGLVYAVLFTVGVAGLMWGLERLRVYWKEKK